METKFGASVHEHGPDPPQVADYAPLVLVDTRDLTEEEWLNWRRKGIGGSDAAAVLGISPFRTARDLYFDKRNIATVEDDAGNWVALKMGHLLEDLVAEIFARKTGFRIYQVKKMFQHPQYPYMLADVDYFIELPDGKKAILEIKTTNYNAKDHWWQDGMEIVPPYYEAQGRHYMAVMNADEVYFCCLYGNNENEVIIRHLTRDAAYEAELIALEGYFWNDNVLAQVPPPYTEDGDLIVASSSRYGGPADPSAPALVLEGGLKEQLASYLCLLARKEAAEVSVKAMEKDLKRLRAMIVAEMGQACEARCELEGTEYAITYNPVRKNEVNKENLLRLQFQHPEIYQEYVTVAEHRRFHVAKVKEKAA